MGLVANFCEIAGDEKSKFYGNLLINFDFVVVALYRPKMMELVINEVV